MRVLVLRPAEAATRTAARLADRGHDAVLAPLLAIRPTGAAPPPGPFDALVLTSANAAASARGYGSRSVRVFAVGLRTAEVARAAGFASVETPGGDARDLVDWLAGCLAAPSRLLLAAGRDRKPEPERGLRAAGHAVAVWTVYAAEPVATLPDAAREALAAGRIGAALHYSRRSADTFRALVAAAGLDREAAGIRHLCLSADVADGLGGGVAAEIAARPDEAALLDLIGR